MKHCWNCNAPVEGKNSIRILIILLAITIIMMIAVYAVENFDSSQLCFVGEAQRDLINNKYSFIVHHCSYFNLTGG